MKLKSFSNKDRYGNMFSIEFFEPDTTIPMMMMIPDMPDGYNGADTSSHPGKPKGTDTVPAWLTPGENVVNAEASRLPGNQEKIDEMNEQGRAIQQAQGGPIPTYEADGGTIYAADGAQVYTKRMPNGRMGVWKGNTFLNYVQEENDGMLKSLRDKIGWGKDSSWSLFNSDGGQVPAVYAADGSWITEDVIKRLIQTESSGRPTVVNPKSGATGAAQIMEKTAIDPGYGVTPILPDERNDPVKSATFARQYLEGIQREHPDWSPAEVLQAYNAGPTRLAEYKAASPEDRVPLKPETIEYPGKILGAPKQEMSFWDRINPISSAQAATNDPEAPPPITKPPLDEFGDVEGFGLNTKEEVERFDLGNTLSRHTGKINSLEKEIQDDLKRIQKNPNAETFFGKPLTEAIVEKKKELDALKSQTPKLKEEVDKADKEVYRVNKPLIDQKIAADAEEAKRKETAKKKAEELLTSAGMSTTPPPPALPGDGAPKLDLTPLQNAAKNNKVTQSDNSVNKSGKDFIKANPGLVGEFSQGLKEAFGDIFNPKELARMVINYAGSRALGYNHNDSINYSANKYVKTMEADLAGRKKFITDKKNLAKYTADSLKLYRRTGDIGVLEEKNAGASGPYTGTSGQMYDTETGELAQIYSVGTEGDKRLIAVDSKGREYDLSSPEARKRFVPKVENIHNVGKMRETFASEGVTYVKDLNSNRTDKQKKIPEGEANNVARRMTDLLQKDRTKYAGLGTQQQQALVSQLALAQ